MPELPDVSVFTSYLKRTALHKRISTARIFDESVIKDVTRRTFQRCLNDRELLSSRRRGKYLFARLSGEDGWLCLHFGMTGFLRYHKTDDDTPEHTRVRLDFTNGYHLSYACQRKLGAVRVVDDLEAFVEEHHVGPDALEIDREAFVDLMHGRRGGIKSALMNQSIVSGLGNVYTDEVLLAARHHPNQTVAEINEEALGNLFDVMQDVLEKAIEAKADPKEVPDTFILPQRVEGASCPTCEGAIDRIEVGGRSTYYCPTCQPKP